MNCFTCTCFQFLKYLKGFLTFWNVAEVCHLYTFYCWERLMGVFPWGFCVFRLFIKWWKMLNISGGKKGKAVIHIWELWSHQKVESKIFHYTENRYVILHNIFMTFLVFVIERELKSKLSYEIVNRKPLDHGNYLNLVYGFSITQNVRSPTTAVFVAFHNLEKE